MANERYVLRYEEWTKVRNDPYFTEHNYKWIQRHIKFKTRNEAHDYMNLCEGMKGIRNALVFDMINNKIV